VIAVPAFPGHTSRTLCLLNSLSSLFVCFRRGLFSRVFLLSIWLAFSPGGFLLVFRLLVGISSFLVALCAPRRVVGPPSTVDSLKLVKLCVLTCMVKKSKQRNVVLSSRRRSNPGPRRGKTSGQAAYAFSRVAVGALARGNPQMVTTLQKWGAPLLLTQAPADSFFNLTFQVSDLQENGAFLIMWSEYRIKKVELMFRPMFRANSVGLQGQILIPQIFVAFDPASSISPVSLAEYQRYSGLVVEDDSQSFAVAFTPRVAQPVYDGIITNAYSVGDRPWLQTAQLSIPHYSVHVAVSGSANVAGPFQEWNVTTRYTLEFRVQR